MNTKNILSTVGKNFGAFIVGGILGALSTLVIVHIAMRHSLEGRSDLGTVVGAIALIPVFLIIYGILGIIIGGILGIITYNLIRYSRKKKEKINKKSDVQ